MYGDEGCLLLSLTISLTVLLAPMNTKYELNVLYRSPVNTTFSFARCSYNPRFLGHENSHEHRFLHPSATSATSSLATSSIIGTTASFAPDT